MKYVIKLYGNTRHLEYTHKDGTKILGLTLTGLLDTIEAYNDIKERVSNGWYI